MTVHAVGWFAENLSAYVGEGRPVAVNELARRIGTDRGLVRKWLRGGSVPNVERAASIVEALGVPPETIMFPAAWRASSSLTADAVSDAACASLRESGSRAEDGGTAGMPS